MAIVNTCKAILEDPYPNIDEFRSLMEENSARVNDIDVDSKGTLLHHAAKNDTIHKRRGVLTDILLYEFGADPNVHVDGSFALTWASKELKGERGTDTYDDEAIKLLLQHKFYDVHISDGTTNTVKFMMEHFVNDKYLVHYMLQMKQLRKYAKMRHLLRNRLIFIHSRMMNEIW